MKCTVLRVGRIGPLRCQRSHVILGKHIKKDKKNEHSKIFSLDVCFSRAASPSLRVFSISFTFGFSFCMDLFFVTLFVSFFALSISLSRFLLFLGVGPQ